METTPDSKVHGASMGPTSGRQDLGGPHVGHMNFALCPIYKHSEKKTAEYTVYIYTRVLFLTAGVMLDTRWSSGKTFHIFTHLDIPCYKMTFQLQMDISYSWRATFLYVLISQALTHWSLGDMAVLYFLKCDFKTDI